MGFLFKYTFGNWYQRPFELALRRLLNMFEILSNWKIYMNDNSYLTQRGATYLLDKSNQILYSFKSTSLLQYSNNMDNPLNEILKTYSINSEIK